MMESKNLSPGSQRNTIIKTQARALFMYLQGYRKRWTGFETAIT